MRKHQTQVFLSIVLVFIVWIAAFLRFSALGSLPAGMSWDEAALGYVGQMVIQTGADEHFNRLPVVFESFGDFKAPLAMYLTGISTSLFGLTTFSTRLPFALAGVTTVVLGMWLSWRIWKNFWLSALCGWLLAITPWHIFFSRIAFESGIALMFFVMMLVGWLELRLFTRQRWQLLAAWTLSLIGLVGGLYVYHSAKVVFPLAVLTIAAIEWQQHSTQWQQRWRHLLAATVAALILLTPLIFTNFWGTGLTRASQTTVFSQSDSFLVGSQVFLQNLFSSMDLRFWAGGATDSLRHSTGQQGVLYWSQLVLLLLGITFVIAHPIRRFIKKRPHPRFAFLHRWFPHQEDSDSLPRWTWLVLLLLGIVPAAIGFETPHPNRALLASVPAILLMIEGVRGLQKELRPTVFLTSLSVVFLIMMLEWGVFWNDYQQHYPARSAEAWMEGYQEAVAAVEPLRQTGKRIKFTTYYGEPAIFYAFTTNMPFDEYRTHRGHQIDFGPISFLDSENYDIIVAAPTQELELPVTKRITRSDDSTAFIIYETP